MSSLLPPILSTPVELVAVDDTALDWSTQDRPEAAVIPFEVAPTVVGQLPDVYVCRPLTALEMLGIKQSLVQGQPHVSTTAILYNGLMEIRPAAGEPITERRALWQAIESHRIPEDVFLGLARWVLEASRGDAAGRRFRPATAADGRGAEG